MTEQKIYSSLGNYDQRRCDVRRRDKPFFFYAFFDDFGKICMRNRCDLKANNLKTAKNVVDAAKQGNPFNEHDVSY